MVPGQSRSAGSTQEPNVADCSAGSRRLRPRGRQERTGPVRSQFLEDVGGIRFFSDGNGRLLQVRVQYRFADPPGGPPKRLRRRCPVTDRLGGVVGQFLHQHAFCSEDAGKMTVDQRKACGQSRDRSATVPVSAGTRGAASTAPRHQERRPLPLSASSLCLPCVARALPPAGGAGHLPATPKCR